MKQVFRQLLFWLILILTFTTCERESEEIIKVQTGIAEAVSYRTATIKGTIIDAGAGIVDYGHCWSETNKPTALLQTKTSFGTRDNAGQFTSNLDNLAANSTYFVKAYAIDEYNDIKYGDNVEIKTLAPEKPQIITSPITSVTEITAEVGGEVISDGGADVIERGVCWDTSTDPTTLNSYKTEGSGVGSFTSSITGLDCNTTYYVRAYATNSFGTAYGSQESFTTSQCPVNLPTVTTTPISSITENSVQSGGNVTDEGGAAVSAKGVCWSTSPSPTTSNSYKTEGSGVGSFTSSITGLDCNTTYYVRAYATNSFGTAYGSQESFTTSQCPVNLPTVTTTPISSITENSVQSGGNVTDEGGAAVSAKGVCWSTSPSPTTSNSYKTEGSGVGSFTSSITGLSCGTTYYVRAYATNLVGTGYGEQRNFSTDDCTVTDHDGNTYQTIVIGSQTWMAENLNVTHYANGTEIPLQTSDIRWDAQTETDKAYCWNDNNVSNGDTYGALYTWAAAMNGAESSDSNPSGIQGVCPDGWHLPSDAEWTELTDYLGGLDIAGGKLKEAGITHWNSPNTWATNESGFTALPGGYRRNYGTFIPIGVKAYFWPATEQGGNGAFIRKLSSDGADVIRVGMLKTNGFSVRCVKD